MKSAELTGTNPLFTLADEAGQATEPTSAVLLANAAEGGHVMSPYGERPTSRMGWAELFTTGATQQESQGTKAHRHARNPIPDAPGHPELSQHAVLRRRP